MAAQYWSESIHSKPFQVYGTVHAWSLIGVLLVLNCSKHFQHKNIATLSSMCLMGRQPQTCTSVGLHSFLEHRALKAVLHLSRVATSMLLAQILSSSRRQG